MLKYMLIVALDLSLLVLTHGDDYYEDDSSEDSENVKITDVLKMIVLPPTHEMKNILNSGNNNTKSRDSSRLDFILQAIEYWRKHNMDENIEEDLGSDNNATKFTFNLRDDFFDDNGSAYSHLSKKTQGKRDGGSNPGQIYPRKRRSKTY